MPVPPTDPDRRDVHPSGGDDGTDPGHGPPYESLYRTASGEPAKPMKPKARHWEPSLRPPDGEHQGFGWLYREEAPPGGPGRPADPSPPRPANPDPITRYPVTPHPVTPDAAGTRVRPIIPAAEQPAAKQPVVRADASPSVAPRPRLRASRVVLFSLVALVVGAVIAVVVNALVNERDPSLLGSNQVPTPASPAAVALTAVQPAQVTASCQAPDATDDAGASVSYRPQNVSDLDPSTAWRCPGSGVGQSITFTFATPANLAQVGLINGYAKVDPASGASRYGEYRRATRVTWAFPDGVAVTQTLTDGVETVQQLNIPALTTNQVTLTIETTTAPGVDQSTRDAMVLSEVAFAAAP